MTEEYQVTGSINPLEPIWTLTSNSTPTVEEILKYATNESLGVEPEDFNNRTHDIREKKWLFFTPNHREFSEKIVVPLRHAISSYILGNHLGTIALCGMVAEMLVIFLFEIAEVILNGKILTDKKEQKNLFGRSFEELGQYRREEVLMAYGVITEEIRQLFKNIRETRNHYLHYYNREHINLPDDAKEIFHKTELLIVKGLGIEVSDQPGKLTLRPELMKFLQKRGSAKKNS